MFHDSCFCACTCARWHVRPGFDYTVCVLHLNPICIDRQTNLMKAYMLRHTHSLHSPSLFPRILSIFLDSPHCRHSLHMIQLSTLFLIFFLVLRRTLALSKCDYFRRFFQNIAESNTANKQTRLLPTKDILG